MADLDVSFLLDDSLFVDEFQLFKRQASVNQDGEGIMPDGKAVNCTGSVQPASQRDIERLPEALRNHEAIRIYTREVLSADEQGRYADVVVWRGSRWQVKAVDDWSNYGDGYVKAICLMEQPNFA
jgi:galactose-6-phosphate isomerase